MILGFVFTTVAQSFVLDFWLTKIFHPLYYIAENNSIHLTPPPNLALLFNQFNNTSPEQNVDPENVVNSRYFDIDEIQALKLLDKEVSIFLLYKCLLNEQKLWWSGVSTKMDKQIIWHNCSKWNQNF